MAEETKQPMPARCRRKSFQNLQGARAAGQLGAGWGSEGRNARPADDGVRLAEGVGADGGVRVGALLERVDGEREERDREQEAEDDADELRAPVSTMFPCAQAERAAR